jgi:KaiC/GvpD/RAD55 family RecA-like ATPase
VNGLERLLRDIDCLDLIGDGLTHKVAAAIADRYPMRRNGTAVASQLAIVGAPATSVEDLFVDWSTFWNEDRPTAEWLIDQIIARGRGHAIYAEKKTGKSLLTVWIAAALATGDEPVTVIYLDYEMTGDDLYERLADFGYGPHSDLSRLRYALLPSLPPLDQPEGAARLLSIIDREEVARPDHHVVLVIDTTSRAVIGDENSADTIRGFYRHTGLALKQRQLTWVRLDHAGKDANQGQRGSSAKGDDVDVIWRLKRSDDGFLLVRDAARMTWVPERVALRRHDNPTRFTIAPAAWPAGTKALADELDLLDVPIDTTIREARGALVTAGQSATQAVLAAAVRYRKGGR